jgi:hypothetical protein
MTGPVEEYMTSHGFEFIARKPYFPSSFKGFWVKRDPPFPECAMDNDAARYLYISSLEAALGELQKLLNYSSGGGDWRRKIIMRIGVLDHQIAAIKGEIHE